MAEKLKKLLALLGVLLTIASCLVGCESNDNPKEEEVRKVVQDENLPYNSTEEYIENMKSFNQGIEDFREYVCSENVSRGDMEFNIAVFEKQKRKIEGYHQYAVAVTEEEKRNLENIQDEFFEKSESIAIFYKDENAEYQLRYNWYNGYTIFHDEYSVMKRENKIYITGREELTLNPIRNMERIDSKTAKVTNSDKKTIANVVNKGGKIIGTIIIM